MDFDFDTIIPRWNTDSLKWRQLHDASVTPMWVADMDFASPPSVREALQTRLDQGVYGYAIATDEVVASVVAWAAQRYNWHIEPEWIVWTPGVVPALYASCMAYADAGQEVSVFTPVYPPFLSAPPDTGRVLREVPLVQTTDGSWAIDFNAFEQSLSPASKLVLLCHPHNPVGRAFTEDELRQLAAVCERHDMIICSDEIHCDLMLDPRQHVPTATIDPEIAARTVTLMSPAKTFNLPGLNCGFAVISNQQLRRRYQQVARGLVPQPNLFGYVGCHAAFTGGEPWRRALIDYLRGNRDYLEAFVREQLPMFPMPHVEATYLAWLDVRCLGDRAGAEFFNAARVRLSDGAAFHGPGYVRLNFGCPRSALIAALDRIKTLVDSSH